jgi:hypothetical protein
MASDQKATETLKALAQLVGLCLCKSRNFCATRHFYFGSVVQSRRRPSIRYTLGLECPWRIETGDQVVTGSEDYIVRADDNSDPEWEAGAPGGHLQDQKLRDFLGEMIDGDIVAVGTQHIVQSVDADSVGGFRIGFSSGYTLATFPSTAREMEWILLPASGDSLMLINGALTRASRSPEARQQSRGGQGPAVGVRSGRGRRSGGRGRTERFLVGPDGAEKRTGGRRL